MPALDCLLVFPDQRLIGWENKTLNTAHTSHHLTVDQVDRFLLFFAIAHPTHGFLLPLSTIQTLESNVQAVKSCLSWFKVGNLLRLLLSEVVLNNLADHLLRKTQLEVPLPGYRLIADVLFARNLSRLKIAKRHLNKNIYTPSPSNIERRQDKPLSPGTANGCTTRWQYIIPARFHGLTFTTHFYKVLSTEDYYYSDQTLPLSVPHLSF